MTTEAQQKTVTINGQEYAVDTLSDTVKNLLVVFNQWQNDRDVAVQALSDAKLALAKHEAALRDLSREIVELVDQEKNPEPAA